MVGGEDGGEGFLSYRFLLSPNLLVPLVSTEGALSYGTLSELRGGRDGIGGWHDAPAMSEL